MDKYQVNILLLRINVQLYHIKANMMVYFSDTELIYGEV